jgi:hypothetical protein
VGEAASEARIARDLNRRRLDLACSVERDEPAVVRVVVEHRAVALEDVVAGHVDSPLPQQLDGRPSSPRRTIADDEPGIFPAGVGDESGLRLRVTPSLAAMPSGAPSSVGATSSGLRMRPGDEQPVGAARHAVHMPDVGHAALQDTGSR